MQRRLEHLETAVLTLEVETHHMNTTGPADLKQTVWEDNRKLNEIILAHDEKEVVVGRPEKTVRRLDTLEGVVAAQKSCGCLKT